MLLENAFFKLPELMMSNSYGEGKVEAMVVQYMANAVQMELNCRSIPFSYSHVVVEKPYPNQNDGGSLYRADLQFSSTGTIPQTSLLPLYGYREVQWLEAKTFFTAKNTSPAKTQNIGRVIKDILRLCLLPEELQGKLRQNGRYLLLVFNKHPSAYFTFTSRTWASNLIENESDEIQIDMSVEKKSFINSIVNSNEFPATLRFKFKRYSFEPYEKNSTASFWGYLYRIDSWSISIDNEQISSDGKNDEYWPAEKIQAFSNVRKLFLNLLGKDEEH